MGDGDPAGVAIPHAMCSGMGGMRTSGDLVARMQMTRGMKIDAAKAYVADKLGVSVSELTDPILMNEVRDDLGIGVLHPHVSSPRGIEAKFRIAELLDIPINSVNRFKKLTKT